MYTGARPPDEGRRAWTEASVPGRLRRFNSERSCSGKGAEFDEEYLRWESAILGDGFGAGGSVRSARSDRAHLGGDRPRDWALARLRLCRNAQRRGGAQGHRGPEWLRGGRTQARGQRGQAARAARLWR